MMDLQINRYLNRFVVFIYLISLVQLTACSTDEPDEEPALSTYVNDPAVLSTLFLQSDEILSVISDDNSFFIDATGLASHQMMVGITLPNDHLPVPQYYSSWAIPLKTAYAVEPVSLETNLKSSPVAVAINGIPIYNSLNLSEEYSGTLAELDNFGGHTGLSDEYHYHLPPLHLQIDDASPIAYALDGFPVYGNREPDGRALEPLDDFGGHEDENSHFHYHATTGQNIIFDKFRGVIKLSENAPENRLANQPAPVLFRTEIYNYLTKYPETSAITINDMSENEEEMGFTITYQVNSEQGTVSYFWDDDEFYTFTYTEPGGTETTMVFKR